jgi:hypothetical protein
MVPRALLALGVACLPALAAAFYLPGVAPQEYKDNEKVCGVCVGNVRREGWGTRGFPGACLAVVPSSPAREGGGALLPLPGPAPWAAGCRGHPAPAHSPVHMDGFFGRVAWRDPRRHAGSAALGPAGARRGFGGCLPRRRCWGVPALGAPAATCALVTASADSHVCQQDHLFQDPAAVQVSVCVLGVRGVSGVRSPCTPTCLPGCRPLS